MNEKLRDSLRNDLRRKMQTSQTAPACLQKCSQKNIEYKSQAVYKPQKTQQTKIEKSQQYRILAKEKIEETKAAAEKYCNSRNSYTDYMDKYYADKQAERNRNKT